MARDITMVQLCEAADETILREPTVDGPNGGRVTLSKCDVIVRRAVFTSLRGSKIGITEKHMITDKERVESAVSLPIETWPFKGGQSYRITFHGDPVPATGEHVPGPASDEPFEVGGNMEFEVKV